jgi:selenide,water dikinase
VLSALPKQPDDPRLLVGYDTADDAGVFLLREGLALVQTVDFFTPIVDDPYTYGRIAALNSLNDVWAMGGEAVTALSVACFPRKGIPFDVLGDIFRGGLDTLVENGVVLLGGHTVDDPQIKFGYAVTGTVDPARILRNGGARPGDALVLTKPLGTGIVSTAIKFKRAPEAVVDSALAAMLHSSRVAGRLAVEHGATCATDVTGFGFLGHAYEIAMASGVLLHFNSSTVPVLPGVLDLAVPKNLTRGDRTNREYAGARVRVGDSVGDRLTRVLFDPQTAGGLLVALPEANARPFVEALHDDGDTTAAIVGHCEASDLGGRIDVD